MNDEPDAHYAKMREDRIRFLLAEYANVGQQHRDEISRLNPSLVALIALVSVTTLFLASDFAAGNFALVAPFGVIAWCLMELSIVTALFTRSSYLAYLERKANRLMEDDGVLEYETKVAALLGPISSETGLSPWVPNYAMLGLLLFGFYVGFGYSAWTHMTNGYMKAILAALMTAAVFGFAGAAWLAFRYVEGWQSFLEPKDLTGGN